MSQQMYDRAMSIAAIQGRNCQNVRDRITAADKVVSKILRLIQDSNLIDGFDDLIRSLDMGSGLGLPFSELAPTTHDKGNVIASY